MTRDGQLNSLKDDGCGTAKWIPLITMSTKLPMDLLNTKGHETANWEIWMIGDWLGHYITKAQVTDELLGVITKINRSYNVDI